ncbi:MAG: peptidylprolyl isomerase [Geobacter sp.]|nr:peptidylprolyl isomerase [Geobacter sp.]
MRISRLVIVVMLALFACYGITLAEEKPDLRKIRAVVSGTPIYEGEIQIELQKILPGSFHGTMSAEKLAEYEKKALDALVEQELLFQAAVAGGVNPDKKQTESDIKDIQKNYQSKKDYQKALELTGIAEKDLAHFIERGRYASQFKKQEVDDKVKVTDDMVKAHYEQNRSSYLKPRVFKVSHILVKVPPTALAEEKAKLKAKAEATLKKLKEGANFAEVAYADSDDDTAMVGGQMRPFHEGQTELPFEEAVKKLNAGEISGIVETIYGYHIIKLHEAEERRQVPFEEIKDKIRKNIEEKERKRLQDELMNRLRPKAKIEYSPKG